MKLEDIKKAVIEEYTDFGLNEDSVQFNQASDCANLVCEIIVTDAAGTKIVGHIYKTFNKDFSASFIARYYND